MPNAPETRRDRHGSSKNGNVERVINLFSYPGVYDMGALLKQELAPTTTRGQRCAYPATSLLAIVAATRACQSLAEALKTLDTSDTWERCRQAHEAMSGVSLPARPPSRDTVTHFRNRISTERVLPLLKQRFRQVGIGQARALGNLLPGTEPDWTNPREQNTIYGDGVPFKPYSQVTTVTHPRTGETAVIGSRARTPKAAIVQKFVTDLSEDGKEGVGVNFVAVHTWTAVGRVVLATGAALRAEQWTALELIEALAEAAEGSIHTVLWDGAVQGWCVDYLMGAHRIQAIGHAIGRNSKRPEFPLVVGPDGDNDQDAALAEVPNDPLGVGEGPLKDRTRRLATEYGVAHASPLAAIARHDLLHNIFHRDEPKPVGTCLYPHRGSFVAVFSKSFPVPAAEHHTESGPCRHELVVDDGGLYTLGVHDEAGYQVKTAYLPCTSSRPSMGPTGKWMVTSEYKIPCSKGRFDYTRAWTPAGTRHTPQTPVAQRRAPDQVGHELRPLNRNDRGFNDVFSRRNDAESFNAWVQKTVPHPGRVASLGIGGQELDFLTAAILNNSETWSRRPTR